MSDAPPWRTPSRRSTTTFDLGTNRDGPKGFVSFQPGCHGSFAAASSVTIVIRYLLPVECQAAKINALEEIIGRHRQTSAGRVSKPAKMGPMSPGVPVSQCTARDVGWKKRKITVVLYF